MGLALAAIGIAGAAMAKKPLGKAVALSAAGIPAAAVLHSTVHTKFERTPEGHNIPSAYVNEVWKKSSMQKKASLVAGIAMPGAFALDYAYNCWVTRNS